MKENIYRVLSLVIGISGLIAFSVEGIDLSTINLSKALNVLTLVVFLLFAIGGSKLISKIKLLRLLNEKTSNAFTTGKDLAK